MKNYFFVAHKRVVTITIYSVMWIVLLIVIVRKQLWSSLPEVICVMHLLSQASLSTYFGLRTNCRYSRQLRVLQGIAVFFPLFLVIHLGYPNNWVYFLSPVLVSLMLTRAGELKESYYLILENAVDFEPMETNYVFLIMCGLAYFLGLSAVSGALSAYPLLYVLLIILSGPLGKACKTVFKELMDVVENLEMPRSALPGILLGLVIYYGSMQQLTVSALYLYLSNMGFSIALLSLRMLLVIIVGYQLLTLTRSHISGINLGESIALSAVLYRVVVYITQNHLPCFSALNPYPFFVAVGAVLLLDTALTRGMKDDVSAIEHIAEILPCLIALGDSGQLGRVFIGPRLIALAVFITVGMGIPLLLATARSPFHLGAMLAAALGLLALYLLLFTLLVKLWRP